MRRLSRAAAKRKPLAIQRQLRAAGAVGQPRHRGHRRTVSALTGRSYPSAIECQRGDELELAQRAKPKLIRDLRHQVVVHLRPRERDELPAVDYRADFAYYDRERRCTVYEDTKGHESDRFRLVKTIWRWHGPGPLLVVRRDDRSGRLRVTETILPAPRRRRRSR
jgi:hypothetical protein